ncbi:serine/threonine-protein kinase rio2-like [Diorhabda sublineata]|uniref:serine/threonine-protein kinase rio2-like n=1 Tax=Diorhabda sublineata TaxID=1163346 RepID=UPI0024E0CD1A|nr:serine/threonine-protein kinase rio2-like [Diorhabda sublineata]
MAEAQEICAGAIEKTGGETGSAQEICRAVNTLNLDDSIDENNNSSENNEINAESNIEEDPSTEVLSLDNAVDSQVEDETDGHEDETSQSEAEIDEKKAEKTETQTKQALSKFKARSLGVAQNSTTFAPQSLIDVPDYAYSLDGGYQSAW